MIPGTSGFLAQDFEIKEQPSKTYRMNDDNSIRGFVDGKEAIQQAIFRILSTERYQYIIYDWNYGIETMDLYGQPISYVCPELERRITEALVWDKRIKSVTDFEFDTSVKGIITTRFIAHTAYGDIKAERAVSI